MVVVRVLAMNLNEHVECILLPPFQPPVRMGLSWLSTGLLGLLDSCDCLSLFGNPSLFLCFFW